MKHIVKLEIETDDDTTLDDVIEAVTTFLPTDSELEISDSAGYKHIHFRNVTVVD